MPIYTVHVPTAAPDLVAEADGTAFVREGFSARAFLFGLFYLLWHRLWLAAVLWLAALAGIVALMVAFHPAAAFPAALFGLMHLYLGAEGADLVRDRLSRQSRPLRDLVSAPDRVTAETVFFTRHPLTPPPPATRQTVARWTSPSDIPAVIGVFPDGSGT